MTDRKPRSLSRRQMLQVTGLSVARRSTSVPFPDFTRGGWSKKRT